MRAVSDQGVEEGYGWGGVRPLVLRTVVLRTDVLRTDVLRTDVLRAVLLGLWWVGLRKLRYLVLVDMMWWVLVLVDPWLVWRMISLALSHHGTVGQVGPAVVEEAVIIAHYPSPGETETHRHQGRAGPHAVSDGEQLSCCDVFSLHTRLTTEVLQD